MPVEVEPGRWHKLRVELAGPTLRVFVDGAKEPAIAFDDTDGAIRDGRVGVRTWGSDVEFRNVVVERIEGTTPLKIEPDPKAAAEAGLSGMWDVVRTGDAVPASPGTPTGRSTRRDRSGSSVASGNGAVGIANRGLNRWGLTVREGHTYAGRVYLRQEGYDGDVTVALQSADGSKTLRAASRSSSIGERLDALRLHADARRHRHERPLRPHDRRRRARSGSIRSTSPGRARNCSTACPSAADIGRALQEQGLTLLRYGGSMVNAPGYRWKKMIGDRDRRPQYKGWWYPYSTNGFGIEEFVQFCRAAGFEPVVAINIEETPQDAADLVEYLNGPTTTEWGRRRAENGHPEPYRPPVPPDRQRGDDERPLHRAIQAPPRRDAPARPEGRAHHRAPGGSRITRSRSGSCRS